jgi:hypothetical protein
MRLICALLAISACAKAGNKDSPQERIEPVVAAIEETDPEEPEIIREVQNVGDIVLFDVATVNARREEGILDLIGGSVAKPEDWPSSFASSQSGSGCTATLLSDSVLQLAAHCVGNGRTSSINANGKTYIGTCTHHPKYRSDSTADYALCKMESPVDREWYEKILVDGSVIKIGTKLTLAGAGCTQPGGGGGFGTFRTGESTVTRLPINDNDTVTSGGAALCFGDSGGSAFFVDGDQRYVMGVNSRGNIRSVSYLSSVFTKTGMDWYKSWAAEKGVKICGIHEDAEKCQGATPPEPEPNPLPEHCKKSFDMVEKCLFGKPRLALSTPEICQADLANLFACEEIAERFED